MIQQIQSDNIQQIQAQVFAITVNAGIRYASFKKVADSGYRLSSGTGVLEVRRTFQITFSCIVPFAVDMEVSFINHIF